MTAPLRPHDDRDGTSIRFDGETAIVTGAGHGLGRAYARELAARGASVVCNDVDAAAAEGVAREIARQGGQAVAETSSVASAAGGAAIVAAAIDAFGSVEIVVNNAGQLRNRAFEDMTADEFDDVLRTHLAGAFYVTQPAYRHMRAAGYGRIVFTSSSAGLFGSPWQANYAAAKAGLVGLGNAVALEGAAHGIAANVILPMALTGIGRTGDPPYPPDVLAETVGALGPLVPYLTVEYVTPLVVYLASRRCSHTGRIFSVGGGHIGRVAVGTTPGWYASSLRGLTPETVAAYLDAFTDPPGLVVPASMNEHTRFVADHLPDPG